MAREAISKKRRFEIFKRDGFCCQYCGAKPPKVPLEVDHIIPIFEGGNNHNENLTTACFDCNRGKGKTELGVVIPTNLEKIERLKLAQAQYRQIKKYIEEASNIIENDINSIMRVYMNYFNGYEFTERFRGSVSQFLKEIGYQEVEEAMHKACSRMYKPNHALSYFCGICWNIIKTR